MEVGVGERGALGLLEEQILRGYGGASEGRGPPGLGLGG